MHKFLAIPDSGLSINLDNVTHVTRNIPWEPVHNRDGKVRNKSGERLEVNVWYGPDSNDITFYDHEALRVNEMFFTQGVHQFSSEFPLWAVLDTTIPDPGLGNPSIEEQKKMYFEKSESIFQAYGRARKKKD
jgi:hypothetical protein